MPLFAESGCLGVFTKPDRIPKGDEEQWMSFIKNDEAPLDFGWYCVKQLDAVQLRKGLGWEEARELEAEWFDSTKPWNCLHSKYSEQLGTVNLVEKLAKTLAALITERWVCWACAIIGW